MLPVKSLWLWHQAKDALRRAQEEHNDCEEQHQHLQKKLKDIEMAVATYPTPKSSDEEITKLLLEQDLWMAQREWERFYAEYQGKAVALEQTMHQQHFEVLQMENELEESSLAEYHRLAERVLQPIVEVRNQSCMGCFLPLSLRNASEWRRAKGLVYCDECGRILV